MQAWLDGKTIEVTLKGTNNWEDKYNEPVWNFTDCEYRIKPKQKVKKTINYHCYESSSGHLVFVNEGSKNYSFYVNVTEYTRIPEFDKTRKIEVEE